MLTLRCPSYTWLFAELLCYWCLLSHLLNIYTKTDWLLLVWNVQWQVFHAFSHWEENKTIDTIDILFRWIATYLYCPWKMIVCLIGGTHFSCNRVPATDMRIQWWPYFFTLIKRDTVNFIWIFFSLMFHFQIFHQVSLNIWLFLR